MGISPSLHHDSGDKINTGSHQVEAGPHPMALAFGGLGFDSLGF